MRTFKPQVAKVFTVCVEKTSEPNYLILVLHSSKLRFIESECDLKMKALFINTHSVALGLQIS